MYGPLLSLTQAPAQPVYGAETAALLHSTSITAMLIPQGVFCKPLERYLEIAFQCAGAGSRAFSYRFTLLTRPYRDERFVFQTDSSSSSWAASS